jgi:hypothetical protein
MAIVPGGTSYWILGRSKVANHVVDERTSPGSWKVENWNQKKPTDAQ